MVEQCPFKALVVGSSPTQPTLQIFMKRFPYRTIALALVVLGLAVYFFLRPQPEPDPTRAWSVEAVRQFGGQSVYFNPPAQPFVAAARPAAVETAGPQIARFADAPIDTRVFRQLDRKLRFDSLVLGGDPALFFPLLQHLISTGDWTLVYVNDALMIFQRLPDKAWTVAHLGPLEEKIERLPQEKRAAVYVRLARQLQALRKLDRAKTELDRALRLDPERPDAHNQLARYYAQKRDFPRALEAIDRALLADPRAPGALFLKTQTLLAMRKGADAYPVSKRLLRESPDDPQVLYLHAKVAREVRALSEEREALEKLVALAEAAGQPAATYRVYLGQAYSANSEPEKALKQFEEALKTDELPPDQRKFAEEAVERLKPVAEK